MTGPVVVAGATGFVGRHLVAHLQAQGVSVRCGTRDPARGRRQHPERSWVRLDVDDPASLHAAFEGASAVVHLVHHMNAPGADLIDTETAGARAVADAAKACGVARVVYLGAPIPPGSTSAHLRARAATGATLHAGGVPCFEVRASMIVGAGSESWRIVRDLALRLPVMVLPRWLRSRTQPIAIADVVAALARCLTLPIEAAGTWDLPGPETLSAREILVRTAAVAGRRPVTLAVPVLTPALSSTWIRLVTRADMAIARKLVDGLTDDLVVDGEGLYAQCPDLPRTPFDEATAQALADPSDQPGGSGAAWEALAGRLSLPA